MNLSDSVEDLAYVGPAYAKKLEKLGIANVYDLVHHIPFRFIDFRNTTNIKNLQPGEFVTVKGEVTQAFSQYTKQGKKLQLFSLKDQTGEMLVVWFNQPFILNSIKVGDQIAVAGKVDWFGRKLAIVSPEYEKGGASVHTGRLLPIYHETAGISSKWLRKRISEVFLKDIEINEFLPTDVLEKHALTNFSDALQKVHFPTSEEDYEQGKKRLAFNELLLMHIQTLKRKQLWEKNDAAFRLKIDQKILSKFISSLPFNLTAAQQRVIKAILDDLTLDKPMNRLIEGDVGSGKTVVAAAGVFMAFVNGYQSVVMAPTQILASQHYKTLKQLLEPFDISVALVTSQTKKAAIQKADVFVGTHALIHQKLEFDRVALVVIDEQHRFGVEQRNHLIKKVGQKNIVPHILTMTATPIPRTVAMSMYGDLDLSVIDELPKNRQKITTWIVPPDKRAGAYNWINEQITKEKTQAYIVCPLIEDSDSETMQQIKSAKAEYEKLTSIFKNLKLGLLHGKLKSSEKDAVLEEFKNGEIDMLVATPVVEVGIDVPNATLMIIETPERFGLAQLHQLRGRVGRGDKKSYCLLMSDPETQKSQARLEALKLSHSGFELAELDLKMRGPGELFGTRQSGFPELKIADWQNIDLIIQTRSIAEDLLKRVDFQLDYPIIHI